MKTVAVSANLSNSLISYRKKLLEDIVNHGHKLVCIAPDSGAKKQIEKIGGKLYKVRLNRSSLNPLYDICYSLSFAKLLKSIRTDVLISHTIKPVIFGSVAAKLAGVKTISSIISGLGYAFIDDCPKQKLTGLAAVLLYRFSMKFNQKVFFQNPDDLSFFLKKGLVNKSQSVLVNGSGVDLEEFSHSAANIQTPVFLCIARLIRSKGIIEYLKAAKIVKQQYPQARFILIAPSYDSPSSLSTDEIHNYEKQNIIEYVGRYSDVKPYLNDCTAFVLPSYYPEGIPKTILEAMSTGRAIITTDTPGCRETVVNGKNGILIKAHNEKSLTEALIKIIKEPQMASKMGILSRKLAETKYDVRNVNKTILSSLNLL